MRYLLTLLLTLTISCGDESAKPTRKDMTEELDGQDMDISDMGGSDMEIDFEMDMESSDMGESIMDKALINMIHKKSDYSFAVVGGFNLEPQPFEFGGSEG